MYQREQGVGQRGEIDGALGRPCLHQHSFSPLWYFIWWNSTWGSTSREISVAEKDESWKTTFKSHNETVNGLWEEQFRAMLNNMGETLYNSTYRKHKTRQNKSMLLEVRTEVIHPWEQWFKGSNTGWCFREFWKCSISWSQSWLHGCVQLWKLIEPHFYVYSSYVYFTSV